VHNIRFVLYRASIYVWPILCDLHCVTYIVWPTLYVLHCAYSQKLSYYQHVYVFSGKIAIYKKRMPSVISSLICYRLLLLAFMFVVKQNGQIIHVIWHVIENMIEIRTNDRKLLYSPETNYLNIHGTQIVSKGVTVNFQLWLIYLSDIDSMWTLSK